MTPAKLFLVGVATILVAVPQALAEPPERIRFTPSEPAVFEGACSFPILLEELVNTTVLTAFSDGRQNFTGRLVVRLTNLDSGETLVVNISGPGFFRVHPDGTATFVLGGRGLLLGNAEMLDPLDPQVTLNSGRMVFTSDAETGEFIRAEFMGRSTDLCAALA